MDTALADEDPHGLEESFKMKRLMDIELNNDKYGDGLKLTHC